MCLGQAEGAHVARRQLVIVPGLGDRGHLYQLFRPLWVLLGYDVHIVVFGWERSGASFVAARQQFLQRITALGEVEIIGVSAGGTAALHALLAHPEVVRRVVTVCTPYTLPASWNRNQLLLESVRDVDPRFRQADAALKRRVLSVHAVYDQRVPGRLSRPRGVRAVGLPTLGHGPSIGAALTLFCWPIWRFLRS